MIVWETYRLQGCENVGRMLFTPPLFTLINTTTTTCRLFGRVCLKRQKIEHVQECCSTRNIRVKTMSINYFTNN